MANELNFDAPLYVGSQDSLAVFADESHAVVVDVNLGLVVEFGNQDLVLDKEWNLAEAEVSPEIVSLAEFALNNKKESSLIASARLYTIPTGVQAEAKKALNWRKEEKRGGTPVGLNTARTLAKGGQIGIEKIRHIAKYFPRHEVDKKGKGWSPGEDNFPSNGRIAWALWGGDAGWRWAKAIVEREDKKPVKAGGDYSYGFGAELGDFKKSIEMDESATPEFLARVRLDGSGIDRVYKIDLDGNVYVWDDGVWDDLGNIESTAWTYDKALDDPNDTTPKEHIQIDPESAVIICARMQSNPFNNVSVYDLDAEEAELAEYAIAEEDWEFIDYAVTAAMGQPDNSVTLKSTVNDGVYTSAERAENVENQARDASGKFAEAGGRVSVAGGAKGTIQKINPDGTADINFDNGATGRIDVKKTRSIDPKSEMTNNTGVVKGKPLDVSGILGEPRTPVSRPYAQLPGTLPAITTKDLHQALSNWSGWVQQQRNQFKDFTDEQVKDYARKTGQSAGSDSGSKKKNHPMYDWLASQNKKLQDYDGSNDWAKPITSAAEAKKEEAASPAPSDVPPLYLAIVAPDDPRAVLELVSIVPESKTSPEPMTYVRKEKKWIREPKVLADLKSATPPPVVPLDESVLNEVLLQVDGIQASAFTYDQALMVLFGPSKELMEYAENQYFEDNLESLLAAGGVDRNRGNAESLRRYWTKGKGAAKIRWGTPGDWKRCVRYLGKYMGVRAKGYCQLRHKEATGVYTGSRLNPGNETSNDSFIMEEVITENYGKPTVVTDKDMLMPIEDIMVEQDDIYDGDWQPEQEIVTACMELAKCSDEEFEALVAGARPPSGFNIDKNRGNAEKLRRYWTKGKGAAKIRWGTGGDWTRCVRYLTKYLGARSKGYCALRHKEVTGLWTGDKEHIRLYGRRGKSGVNVFSNEVVNSSSKVVEMATLRAQANALKERMGLVASMGGEYGATFSIPLVIPEGVESGDGRKFRKGAIEMRELPLPLMWQIETADGHQGSVVVGRIDQMERIEDGIGNATGVFDTGVHAKEVQRLIQNGFIRGISADMDKFEATEDKKEKEEEEDSLENKTVGKDRITINKARIMGITIVPKPAFQECQIFLATPTNQQEETMIPNGIYADDADSSDAESLVACAFVAGAIPVSPPAEWFANPKLSKATPLTVDDNGRVFGHIAAWNVDHIGMAYGTKPPRSKSNYSYFHTGVVRTDAGKDVPVGQLTLAGGHASLEASAFEAVKHYDDTASAIADVHAGEDAYGIWVAGSLRPGAQPEQIRALRASAPSGDWRPIRGNLELVAVCQVNVPGFPIARARVASGAVMALVAAGASTLAKLKADPMTELATRIKKLETLAVSDRMDEIVSAKSKFAAIKVERKAELSVKAAELSARVKGGEVDAFAYISRDTREELAKKGEALPDGSYPIRNVDDLKNAIKSYGRSKESDRAKVRKHIIKRASALKVRHMVPEEWRGDFDAETVVASADDLRSRTMAVQERLGKALATESPAVVAEDENGNPILVDGQQDVQVPVATPEKEEKPIEEEAPSVLDEPAQGEPLPTTVESGVPDASGKYTAQTQPRDEEGKFRQVLARLKRDLGTAGLQRIVEDAKYVDRLHEIGNYAEAAGAGVNLLDILDRLDEGALNKVSLENVRSSARELGKVISNLPLGFNNQNEKVRYSDLPPALQGLMDDMITRVEAKIGKKDADIATESLRAFKNGSDVYSQGEISGQMSKLLRLLT